MVDIEDDVKIGVKSTAIVFGNNVKLILACLQGLILSLYVALGILQGLIWVFYVSLGFAALLAAYQQYLIRDYDRKKCFQAFLNNHYFGLVILLGIVINYGLRH